MLKKSKRLSARRGVAPVAIKRGRPKRNEEAVDVGPTPETAAKLERDRLQTLREENRLTPDQEAAGRELHVMWRALKRGMLPMSKVAPRAPLPARPAYKECFVRMNGLEEALWSQRYKPWADAESRMTICTNPKLSSLELVRKVVADNAAPASLALTHRLAEENVIKNLREALERYSAHRRGKLLLT